MSRAEGERNHLQPALEGFLGLCGAGARREVLGFLAPERLPTLCPAERAIKACVGEAPWGGDRLRHRCPAKPALLVSKRFNMASEERVRTPAAWRGPGLRTPE